ncbi:MAG: hypothetical protein ACTSXH_13030 [Promethearchaeota archaeon]
MHSLHSSFNEVIQAPKLVDSALNAVIQLSSHLMEIEHGLENLEKSKRGKRIKKEEMGEFLNRSTQKSLFFLRFHHPMSQAHQRRKYVKEILE